MTAKKAAKTVKVATEVTETTKEKIGHMADSIGQITGDLATKAKEALSGIGHAIVDHLPGRGKKAAKKGAKKAIKSVRTAAKKANTTVAKKSAKVVKVAKKATKKIAKKAAQ